MALSKNGRIIQQRVLENKYYRSVYFWGFIMMPLFYWSHASVPYEVPKGWFLGLWVFALSIYSLFTLFRHKMAIDKVSYSLTFPLAFYLLVAVVASYNGFDFTKSLWGNYYRVDGLIHLFMLAIFAFTVWLGKVKKEEIVAGIVAGSALSALWAIGQRLAGFAITPAAGFGNPNFLAGYLAVTLPFALYLLHRLKGKSFMYGVIGIIIFAIVLTGSVGGLLTLAGGLLLWVVFNRKLLLVLFLTLSLVGALLFATQKVYDYQNRPLDAPFVAESRERIFTKVWLGTAQRPWLGWGVANVDAAFEANDWPLKFESDVYLDKAHSHVLESLATTGVIGLASYVGLLGAVGLALYRKCKLAKTGSARVWAKTLIVVLAVYVFHTQTNVVSVAEDVIFWTILGSVWGRRA